MSEHSSKRDSKREAQKLLSSLSSFRQTRTTIVLASTVINMLALAFPLLMLQMYDRILPNQTIETLVIFTVGVLIALTIEVILTISRSSITSWVSARFEHQAMMAVVSRFLNEPIHQFEKKGTGEVNEIFKSIAQIKSYYSGSTFQQMLDLPFSILYILVIFMISPLLGIVLVVGYVIYGLISFVVSKRTAELSFDRKSAELRRGNFINETIHNIHTIKSMSMESLMMRRFERLQEACARALAKATYSMEMTNGLGNIFSPIMTMIVLAVGAAMAINHMLTIGELAACILLGMRSLAPFQRLGMVFSKVRQDRKLSDALVNILKEPGLPVVAEPQVVELNPINPVEITHEAATLEVQNISYVYPRSERQVFDNLSFRVDAGEFVVLLGETNSGRSTLLQIMAGIIQPDQGDIYLNGASLRDLRSHGDLGGIVCLSPNAKMFEGSLLDNVTVFRPERVAYAMHVAEKLGLSSFVSRLPRGWDTMVGDAAVETLPPGYRQRISIVRAFASRPDVVLFDDANTDIDTNGDNLLLEFLASIKGHVTVVLVSQREVFRKLATRTLTLRDGQLHENEEDFFFSSSFAKPQSVMVEDSSKAEHIPTLTDPVADRSAVLNAYLPSEYFTRTSTSLRDETGHWHHVAETIDSSFRHPSDLSRCMPLILKLLNVTKSAREIAEALPYFYDNLDMNGFQNAMAQLGFKMDQVDCTLDDLEPRSLPCLFVPEGQACFVVIGKVGKQMRVGTDIESPIEFESNLGMKGTAYFIEPVETEKVNRQHWVKELLMRFFPLTLHAGISSFFYGFILLTGPLFLMVVYSSVIPAGAIDTLMYLSLGTFLAMCSGYFFLRHRVSILSYVAGRLEYLFGSSILKQLLTMPPAYTESASVGAQTVRIQSFESIRDIFTGQLASLVLEIPVLIVFLVTLALLNPYALIVFVICFVAYGLLYLFFSRSINKNVTSLSNATTKRNAFLVECIGKMRLIRECSAEQQWLKRFRELSGECSMSAYHSEKLTSTLQGISHFVMMSSALLIVLLTVPAVLDMTLTSGALIASMMLMWRILQPFQTVFINMNRIERIKQTARQIDGLMQIQGERFDAVDATNRDYLGQIDFARVSFRYAQGVDPALVGVEFRVKPGEMVAISGPDGGGKSTLFKLLLGMYQPQAGAVLVDNVDIRQINPIELRRIIGYVPEDGSHIFRATILQNMRMVRPDASEQEVMQALDMAGCLEQVLALPGGLDFRGGDNNQDLSLSLRKKLALARAYLTRAPILLFDEPTAGLDPAADRKFAEVLLALKGKATVFFISHKPIHIKLADTLMVFDKGYLRAAGPPSELLRQPASPN